MDRRRALSLTASLLGTAVIGSEFFLAGCTNHTDGGMVLSGNEILFLDEIGETILPESEQSPGAKAARIGEFMWTMVNDCYSPEESETFLAGIKNIQDASVEKFNNGFLNISAGERNELLSEIDIEARNEIRNGKNHFFAMMKQLTIWGYFSSEIGSTKALRFNPVPGRYEGCVPYNKGEKAWA